MATDPSTARRRDPHDDRSVVVTIVVAMAVLLGLLLALWSATACVSEEGGVVCGDHPPAPWHEQRWAEEVGDG